MIYFDTITLKSKGMRPRPAWTYRGARRNADHRETAASARKAMRLALGITRRDLDRRLRAEKIQRGQAA